MKAASRTERSMKTAWLEKAIYILVILIVVGEALIHNPIRFHQTVTMDGVTMDVPVLWTPVKDPSGGAGVVAALRREWARSGTVDVTDRAIVNPTGGPWTEQTAERQREFINAIQQKDQRFSNTRFMELPAGRFHAICGEANFSGNQALTCYVVGTRLQFSYLGSSTREADAEKMLASLH
jgi:hypothetical protein